MTNYKIGCSPITGKIFAGNVKGAMWQGKKHDVTDMAVGAVAEHLLHTDTSVIFTIASKEYILKLEPVKK